MRYRDQYEPNLQCLPLQTELGKRVSRILAEEHAKRLENLSADYEAIERRLYEAVRSEKESKS